MTQTKSRKEAENRILNRAIIISTFQVFTMVEQNPEWKKMKYLTTEGLKSEGEVPGLIAGRTLNPSLRRLSLKLP